MPASSSIAYIHRISNDGPLVAVTLVGALWAFQRRLVYFPDAATPTLPAGARPVVLRTADGLDLGAWHLPGRQYLVESGIAADRLLYYGESLGAAVVAELATEHPSACLLLRSPFVDLAAAGRAHYPFLPVGLLLRDRFPVAEHVARTGVPTTVVYGTADTVVPPEQSLAVAKAANASVVAVDADHNDRVLLDGKALIDAVVELASSCQP
jgi:fermentation-respiration switch protein FrsA (DUF1100 family)